MTCWELEFERRSIVFVCRGERLERQGEWFVDGIPAGGYTIHDIESLNPEKKEKPK